MKISEEQLKALVLRIQKELEAEKNQDSVFENRQKVYMLCSTSWSRQYTEFLQAMDASGAYDVYPVIPSSWENQGYGTALKSYNSCCRILYRSCQHPADLEQAVTVFPVVPRDVLVKTALCIGDTFENAWITACLEAGSRIVFLRSGLAKFSGKEPAAYVDRIMEYCRQVLEYGIRIGGVEALSEDEAKAQEESRCNPVPATERIVRPEYLAPLPPVTNQGKKRVITSANLEQFARDGVIYLQQGDIVTDVAKDRAKFLNIKFR